MPVGGQTGVMLVVARRLGQTEVENLDRRLLALSREHQVARLDVAMDEPLLVRVLEAQSRLIDEHASVGNRQRPLNLDHLREVEPLDVLHGEDDALTEPECRISRDDIRMPELGDGPHLTVEAIDDARGAP